MIDWDRMVGIEWTGWKGWDRMDWVEGLGIEWTGWKDWDRMDWAKKIYIYIPYI